ncbi:MAG: ferrous iron transport protein B [Calditrichaeota bacterium]|nr:ferrous iron transport protein B [Calditrichota bacterium]
MELIRQKIESRSLTSRKMPDTEATPTIVLVGNPNVGKSVVFGYLTKKYVTVSNYPGTTVEIAQGKVHYKGKTYRLIDTPGTNSLLPNSEDEKVTRDIILGGHVSAIIQIGDAKNLFRTLYLTIQLLETRLPLILNLNMMDEARSSGVEVDLDRLESILQVAINQSVAIRKQGLDTILPKVVMSTPTDFFVNYGGLIEDAIQKIESLLPAFHVSKRALALMLISGDETLLEWLKQWLSVETIAEIGRVVTELAQKYDEPLDVVISRVRIRKVNEILRQVQHQEVKEVNTVSRFLGDLAIHPVWGVPILLLVLYGMYQIVGVFGAGTMVDFFENVIFGEWINPAARYVVDQLVPFALVRDFLVGEYGMITMALAYGFAIILPIVATFFFLFSILEDSGYLPRLAAMMNRIFRVMGLNGKAILPMVLGLGCDTMATLTTRILETRKERVIVTLLLALGVPCSAQLGVILAMTSVLPFSATLIWISIILGVLFMVGYLSAKLVGGPKSDFIIELPPIRLPAFSNIFYKTLARIEWYLKEVIPLFILGTAILFVLDKLHILSIIRVAASPVIVKWLGLPMEATDAFLIGFLRRDYGAAGLFQLSREGMLTSNQVLVSIVTITLFIPCIANFLMIIKERGLKIALQMTAFILPFALLVGGLLNMSLNLLGVKF